MENARMINDHTAIVTYPVDVWFNGSRTFRAELDFGGRAIERVLLDPGCRFPGSRSERQRVAAQRRGAGPGRWPRRARRGGNAAACPGDAP